MRALSCTAVGLLALTVAAQGSFASDEADEAMPGRVTVVKPGTLFRFVAKPAPGDAFALPSAANDPTAEGGSLRAFDTAATGGDDSYALPAAGWKGLGNPAGTKGFKYKGAGTPGDPCKVVLVKPTVVKAVCKGSDVLLTPPFDGDVAVVLTLGTDSKRYCATFGGDEKANRIGLLKRIGAPAAPCAGSSTTTSTSSTTTTTILTVCGDGVEEGAEQCDDGNTLPGDGCDANCLPEETTSQPVSGGGTVSSDDEADGATAADPLETSVTSPVAGTVTIVESSPTGSPPAGYVLAGQAAQVTAPASSTTSPLSFQFVLDASQLRPGDSETTVEVFRDGALVRACVGGAGEAYPEPCIFERVLLAGDDVRLGVRTAHASEWTFGFPLCGNGMLDAGEACDPPGVQAQCSAGQLCKSDCTCAAACNCCATAPTTLTVTHVPGPGVCGTKETATGAATNLDCGSVYSGGGGNSVPSFPLPEITSVLAVTGCDPATERLTLGPTTAGQTGNAGTCTEAGCRFGAPIAVPNPGATPTSICLVVTRPAAATGTTSCEGVASIGFPLTAVLYLTGDTAPDPGIQPCPLCDTDTDTCVGGPNNGMACTAENTASTDSYPTSNDCPPDPMFDIGTIPVGATLTTGIARAEGKPSGGQFRVFCGYCRDADGTGLFEQPANQCFENGVAVGNGCTGTFEACQQRNQGAFGPNGGNIRTITLTGGVPGCLADELTHPARVVGGMCIAPTFDATVDAAGDFPGPAAFSLNGTFQLQ